MIILIIFDVFGGVYKYVHVQSGPRKTPQKRRFLNICTIQSITFWGVWGKNQYMKSVRHCDIYLFLKMAKKHVKYIAQV